MAEYGLPVKDSVRQFSSGANRNNDALKLDFEGFLSPLVLEAFAEYMNKNRYLQDGSFRNSDNWQKGIPLDSYIKSWWRHFFDVWKEHRGVKTKEGIVLGLLGSMFNNMGYLHELIKSDPEIINRTFTQ